MSHEISGGGDVDCQKGLQVALGHSESRYLEFTLQARENISIHTTAIWMLHFFISGG